MSSIHEAAIAFMMENGDECARKGVDAWEFAKAKVSGGMHYGRTNTEAGDPAGELKRRLANLAWDVQKVIDKVRIPARLLDLERYSRGGVPAEDAGRALAAVQALDVIQEGLGRLAQALNFAQ